MRVSYSCAVYVPEASALSMSKNTHSKANVALRRRRLLRNKSDYFRIIHAA